MSAVEGDQTRVQCTPCRGTGRLISGLGGTPKEVPCPWCGGDGVFHPGRDAQQPGEPHAPPPADEPH